MHSKLIKLLTDCANDSAHDLLHGRDPSSYADKLLKHAELVTWHQDGELRALVAFYANDAESGIAFVTMVAVDPEHRRSGIASTLLTAALSIMSSRGYRKCRLEVTADNVRALHLYLSMGFSEISRNGQSLTLETNLEIATPASK